LSLKFDLKVSLCIINIMNALSGTDHKERLKQYYEKHKEIITERHKQYYEKNKTNILDLRKQKITCECKSIVRRGDFKRHQRSKKHQDFLNNQ